MGQPILIKHATRSKILKLDFADVRRHPSIPSENRSESLDSQGYWDDTDNNPKAAEYYSEVKKVVKGEEPSLITECVSLAGIKDNGKRVQFFVDLMNGMPGFQLRTVRDVKAERLPTVRQGNANRTDDDGKDKMEDMVKKMALAGGSVWTSPEFKTMVDRGFFVYSAKWLGTESDGENRVIEFEAGFSSGECLDFAVRVLGLYKRNEHGDLESKISPMNSNERENLRGLVHDTAFDALEKAQPMEPKERIGATAPAHG